MFQWRLLGNYEPQIGCSSGCPTFDEPNFLSTNQIDPSCDTHRLFERSDVKIRGNLLYVADTNNHLVRIFDLDKKVLKTLAIKE
jgi:hypothetical protein